MKKILFSILIIFAFIASPLALRISTISIKWTESFGSNVRNIYKTNNKYYIFRDNNISRFSTKAQKEEKEYSINGEYKAYIEDNKIYLFVLPTNSDRLVTRVLDLDFNILLEKELPISGILHYLPANGGYVMFGHTGSSTTGYKIHYLKLDNTYNVTEQKEMTLGNKIPYFSGEKNGAYFFDFAQESFVIKYDGNFSTIDKTDRPDNVVYPSYFEFIGNFFEGDVYPQSEIEEAAYDAIYDKMPSPPNVDGTDMQIIKDGSNYVAFFEEYNSTPNHNQTNFTQRILFYYDSNFNEKWRITTPAYSKTYQECSAPDERTALTALDGNILYLSNETTTQTFKIYGSNKEELASLPASELPDVSYYPYFADFTEKGLFVIYHLKIGGCSEANKMEHIDPINPFNKPNTKYNVQFLVSPSPYLAYYLEYSYNIYTKKTGEGTISVNKETANSNDEVEFTITPAEGYVLGEVKVTDSRGNTVVFTQNKFTMPSADVTIEVVFLAINPGTGAFITKTFAIVLTLLTIASIVYLIKYKPKFNKS